jgi:hypothetical protein
VTRETHRTLYNIIKYIKTIHQYVEVVVLGLNKQCVCNPMTHQNTITKYMNSRSVLLVYVWQQTNGPERLKIIIHYVDLTYPDDGPHVYVISGFLPHDIGNRVIVVHLELDT